VTQLSHELLLPMDISSLSDGGLDEGSNILLNGPPGVGKTIFCENFIRSYLQKDMSCIYVTLEKTPQEISHHFQRNGVDLSSDRYREKMIFVDGYTWLIGESKERFHIESLSNLTELNFKIFSASMKLKRPILMIFNSISPLTLYNPETFVSKSLQLLFARIKEMGGLGIFTIQTGVHDPRFYNTLEYLVDGIFDMKFGEHKGSIKRYFRIRSLRSARHKMDWVPFTIEPEREIKLHTRSEERE
jgi:KaiC/GvpD/RAD55 family RecA-like ATPase